MPPKPQTTSTTSSPAKKQQKVDTYFPKLTAEFLKDVEETLLRLWTVSRLKRAQKNKTPYHKAAKKVEDGVRLLQEGWLSLSEDEKQVFLVSLPNPETEMALFSCPPKVLECVYGGHHYTIPDYAAISADVTHRLNLTGTFSLQILEKSGSGGGENDWEDELLRYLVNKLSHANGGRIFKFYNLTDDNLGPRYCDAEKFVRDVQRALIFGRGALPRNSALRDFEDISIASCLERILKPKTEELPTP